VRPGCSATPCAFTCALGQRQHRCIAAADAAAADGDEEIAALCIERGAIDAASRPAAAPAITSPALRALSAVSLPSMRRREY
jgi:hypothetical protein